MSEIVKELDTVNFEEFISKGKTVVEFGAEWCGPCKMLAPIFNEVASDMKGKVKFGKVDIDGEQDLAERFGVMSVPTIVFFKDGDQVQMNVGFVDKKKLSEIIKSSF